GRMPRFPSSKPTRSEDRPRPVPAVQPFQPLATPPELPTVEDLAHPGGPPSQDGAFGRNCNRILLAASGSETVGSKTAARICRMVAGRMRHAANLLEIIPTPTPMRQPWRRPQDTEPLDGVGGVWLQAPAARCSKSSGSCPGVNCRLH